MFCRKCGTELPDDSIFCQNCGSRLDNASTQQTISSPPVTELTPVDQWISNANQNYQNKNYDSAQRYAERILEIEPQNATAHDILFNILVDKSKSSYSAFKKNIKEAVDHAVNCATNVPSQASGYMNICAETVQQRVEREEKEFQSLSHRSLLPGMSERAHAVKDAARYYYLLEAMIYIFRIPNADREIAAKCYGKMYSMKKIYAVLILGEQKYRQNVDSNFDFIKLLKTQTLENYPTLNITL